MEKDRRISVRISSVYMDEEAMFIDARDDDDTLWQFQLNVGEDDGLIEAFFEVQDNDEEVLSLFVDSDNKLTGFSSLGSL